MIKLDFITGYNPEIKNHLDWRCIKFARHVEFVMKYAVYESICTCCFFLDVESVTAVFRHQLANSDTG